MVEKASERLDAKQKGAAVGRPVGWSETEGLADGCGEGPAVGCGEGPADGEGVGPADGAAVAMPAGPTKGEVGQAVAA